MYEYKCIKIGKKDIETEDILNNLAKEGWRLVCYFYHGYYITLERLKEEK